MKYITRFMTFIVTAYAAFYILIPYEIHSIVDFLIFSSVILTIFVIFVFTSRYEEEEFPELNKSILLKMWKYSLINFLALTLPMIVLVTIYYFFITKSLLSALFISYLHTIMVTGGLSTSISSKRRIVNTVISILIFHPLLLWSAKNVGILIPTQFKIFLIIGTILTILSPIIYIFVRKNKSFLYIASFVFYKKTKKKTVKKSLKTKN